MALLVDKHRPRTLQTLTYHPELSERLKALVSWKQDRHSHTAQRLTDGIQATSGDFPHLLIYGPSGAGKKTRVTATLRELYGPGVEKIKIDSRVFQTTRCGSRHKTSHTNRPTDTSVPATANSNSTLSPQTTTSKSPPQT
jgi:DNA polymerase III delta prime subunit